jgi:iron complex outermembrane receptor protein
MKRYQIQILVWIAALFTCAVSSGEAIATSEAVSLEAQAEMEKGDRLTSVAENEAVNGADFGAISSEAQIIPTLNDLEHPATTLTEWIAQLMTSITRVLITPTATGIGIELEASAPLTVSNSSTLGNAVVLDIENTELALPEGDEFQAVAPAPGIALVAVTPYQDGVRLAVTGTEAPPTVDISAVAQGLQIAVVPGTDSSAASDEAIQLVVTGTQNEGYNPSNSSTATGTDTPLRDIPLSIQVIPQQVLEDRNVTELGEALETAPGVVSAGGRGTSVFGPGFRIRGFENRGGIFRDGIQTFSLAPLSTSDIERVEILRGPASVLFGQGEPGGIINLVPKRPLSDPFHELSLRAGSFNTFGGDLDLSGPINEARTIRYRLNLSYETYDSFRDLVNGERFLISPIITWDISPNTSLDVYGQYAYNRETIDEGIPIIGNEIADVPRSRFFGEQFGEFSQDQFNLGYRLIHRVNDNLSLRHSLQYLQYEPERYAPLFDFLDEETGDLNRFAFFAGGIYRRFFTNAEAIASFNTGSVGHQVLFGVEYRNTIEKPEFQFSDSYPAINIFNPVYTRRPFDIEPEFFRDDRINTISVYLQDQIELLPNLKVLAGIRYDSADQFRTTRRVGQNRREFEQTDTAFSPRVGIVYQPIDPISLYASYTTSFSPSFGASRNADNSSFDPETGQQFEIGAKADLSERLSLTLAAFEIRRQNIQTPDPNNRAFTVQTGEVTSRGIELFLNGQIQAGWNITAGYTLLDAFVSKDNTDVVGNSLANVPDHQLSLWTTYEIQGGDLAGLGFGLGLFYLSDRPGDLENTFTLPSYFRTDAALFYRRDNWRAQVNVENLFNINYFVSSDEFAAVNPGAPLSVSARFAVEF